jgi:hypothetical protein
VHRQSDGTYEVEADAPELEIVRGTPPWLELA